MPAIQAWLPPRGQRWWHDEAQMSSSVHRDSPAHTGPLQVAVVGCWHVHAADYARAAQDHTDTRLIAVWDDESARGAAFAADFGIDYVTDLQELLGRPELDGVLVTTATTDHRRVLLAAAAAGKHLFTEKLLAPAVENCAEIIRASVDHGVALVVSLPRLAHGYARAIGDVIDSGSLGPLSYARVRLAHDGASGGWLPERFFDPQTAVGGALTDLGCHPAYLVQAFLGERPDRVTATYGSLTGRAVEDHAVVVLEYPGGAIGVVEASFVGTTPFLIELYGTAGGLTYSDDNGELRGFGAAFGGSSVSLPVPADGPSPFAQWVEHIRKGTAAEDNLRRATELTRLVSAANLAARTT
jgi:1,5-anhydro-D-fructose reductase (1,5-anhydro-D-mannitol-forming)